MSIVGLPEASQLPAAGPAAGPARGARVPVCVGLQCRSQRAAWPLSAALSYLSRARPDSQPGLPRHKGGLVLGETGVSNPPRARPGRCLLRRSRTF